MTELTKDEAAALLARYTTTTTIVDNGPGRWNYLDVDIFEDGTKIGSYRRNYSSLIHTFVPFIQGDQVYALYSPHYTATRIMRLPECIDLGGEEPTDGGFCPAEFYVPYDPGRGLTGAFGFVGGCVWGDDSSWKIQYLDLSQASEGIIKRDARFGYLPYPDDMRLDQAVDLRGYRMADKYQLISFSMLRTFSLAQSKFDDDENFE